MHNSFIPRRISASERRVFHRRSMEQQQPLSTVTMAFTVVAFLIFVIARSHVSGAELPIIWRLACAAVMALLVAGIPRTSSTFVFGLIGVVYVCVLQLGAMLNVVGVAQPLFWLLPAGMVVPICAAPLWLTPRHFLVGTMAFYLTALPFLLSLTFTHDYWVLCAMWMTIGIPTATAFHFGFYWFRLNHFLLEEQLIALAATDPLTGLLNRGAFLDKADQLLSHSRLSGVPVSAVFLDIDRFKSLNDQYGHARGDDALVQVTHALQGTVQKDMLVGRLGGEEFAVLLPVTRPDYAVELAEKLRLRVAGIPRPDGFLTASFGVAHYRSDETVNELLDRADEALLRAKQAGRNRVFDERVNKVDPVRSTAIHQDSKPSPGTEVEQSTRWGDFDLFSHFQPLYSLSHQKQVGFEALLRGRDQHGRIVQPATLFAQPHNPLLEQLDSLSHHLHLRTAQQRLPANTWLFLNVAPSTFTQAGYEQTLARMVSDAGLDPASVVLEILETAGSCVEELALAAWRYRGCGFLIAVDDFGAGHSNLDRLLRIQPDFVKIDGELIRAKSRASDQPLLPNIVSLLHQADMLVVVEGIETTEELILAVESNVDFAQGFLLGRPSAVIPPSDVVRRRIDHAFDVIVEARVEKSRRFYAQIYPYLLSVKAAADALMKGAAISEAIAPVASLDLCKHCFVLDSSGRMVGSEITGNAGSSGNFRLGPVLNSNSARWDHRPYYWKAVTNLGKPVYSHPHLSLTSGRTSVGVTIAFKLNEQVMVVGTELDWTSPHLAWPTIE